ncbi:cytochrome P450 81Q32-like [Lycium ferocissimum]|uniref:cytochrome P450 81Q32-like n=1 Tax=Lycium ferocissimum TaxID=112874 RepID=UPI002815506E|nr:cytochrome P450 81Q32-like [Lycium ferocissimum]
MEVVWLFAPLSISLLFLVFKLLVSSRPKQHNLPPSPALKLPIIGHLYILKQHMHRTLENLSEKYGPILSLRLGKRLVVVVSSPSMVKECLTKNDIVFANRPPLMVGGYNCTTIIDSPYGDNWLSLRRICRLEIFSSSCLNKSQTIRQHEVNLLVHKLCQNCHDFGTIVELKSMFSELSFNIIMRMVAGNRYFNQDKGNQKATCLRELIEEFFSKGGASNVDDFLPVPFCWIYKRTKVKQLGHKMDEFMQGLIDEYRGAEKQNTMIDHLLSLQESQPEYYTDEIIKGIIMVILSGGTDTTSVTIEWAMTLLLNHPEVLNKAKTELDNHVGSDHLVDEADLPKLKYLQSIISETFRLCPVAPMLVPHESSDVTKVGGFDIPRGTILLVNAWAIHRDPLVWADPESFKPERFEGIEVKPWILLPFGIGRRSCPGAGLAQHVIALALGTLIQCFEWQRVSQEEINLAEGKGLSMAKAEPLIARCKAHDIAYKVLSDRI